MQDCEERVAFLGTLCLAGWWQDEGLVRLQWDSTEPLNQSGRSFIATVVNRDDHVGGVHVHATSLVFDAQFDSEEQMRGATTDLMARIKTALGNVSSSAFAELRERRTPIEDNPALVSYARASHEGR